MSGRRSGWLLLSLVLLVFVLGADLPRSADEIDRIARPYGFSIARWEAGNLLDKWMHKAAGVLGGGGGGEEGIGLVLDYFSSGGDESHGLEDRVEEVVEAQISAVYAEEGLAAPVSLGRRVDFLFPPVDFEFDRLPHILIVSPRERIELSKAVLLRQELEVAEMEAIEGRVEGLGGVATYPSMIPEAATLEYTIETAAHEWLHQYLFFRPLGRAYRQSYEMTTVNETVASMVGKEVCRRILKRHYGMEKEEEEGEKPTVFTETMGETRLRVDDMLARGEVEEAEEYMEQQRRFLESKGYYLRRLNQAYFAFHGTYADDPASVSAIGGEARGLRARFPSLGGFIRAVAGVSSYGEWRGLVGR